MEEIDEILAERRKTGNQEKQNTKKVCCVFSASMQQAL